MSEEVTGSGELLSRVQEDELKDSERKRMDLIQSNAALQKILKACREKEVYAQQEIASLRKRLVSLTLYPRKTCFHIAKTHVVNDKRRVFKSGRSGSFLMCSWRYRTALP